MGVDSAVVLIQLERIRRAPRRFACTICTAIAPGAARTVRTYATNRGYEVNLDGMEGPGWASPQVIVGCRAGVPWPVEPQMWEAPVLVKRTAHQPNRPSCGNQPRISD